VRDNGGDDPPVTELALEKVCCIGDVGDVGVVAIAGAVYFSLTLHNRQAEELLLWMWTIRSERAHVRVCAGRGDCVIGDRSEYLIDMQAYLLPTQ
jgi:hypothetical protein